MLRHVLGLSEAGLLARSEEPVEELAATRYRDLLARRLEGEPIAYILGEREFYGRQFEVDPRVLIPRPETEHLIEAALELELPAAPHVLDVGTGSGCIAITLALELVDARVVAIDRSAPALAVAAANVARYGVAERVRLARGDLAGAIDLARFDLVVSNPPYVDPEVRAELSSEVTRFEPGEAIFAFDRGLAVLEELIASLADLRSGTPVLLEIGYDQAAAVPELASSAGLATLDIRHDLAGHPRVAVLSAP